MPEKDKIVSCEHCGISYDKDDLQRDCGNCFACTGCEIYICPECRKAIVVKPIKKPEIKK